MSTPMYDLTDVQSVPISAIQVDPDNRTAGGLGNIEALAASIETKGQLVPAIVADMGDGTYRMIDGHRRLAAIQSLGVEGDKIAAFVVASTNDGIDLMAGLAANEMRQNLTDADRARAYQMVLMDVPADEVARATGIDAGKAAQIGRIAKRVKPEYVTSLESLSRIADYELVNGARDIIDTWDGDTDKLADALADHARGQKFVDYAAEHYPGIPVALATWAEKREWISSLCGRMLTADEPCGCEGFRAVYINERYGFQSVEQPDLMCTTPESHAAEIEAYSAAATSEREQRMREIQEVRLLAEQLKSEQNQQRHARLAWLWDYFKKSSANTSANCFRSYGAALTARFIVLDEGTTDNAFALLSECAPDDIDAADPISCALTIACMGAACAEDTIADLINDDGSIDAAMFSQATIAALAAYRDMLIEYGLPAELMPPQVA